MLSASDIALSRSDPFGLWHDYYGDPKWKDPEDEYLLFLKEQGQKIERELLRLRHRDYSDLSGRPFEAAVGPTTDLLKSGCAVIYGGALESLPLGLRARPDVMELKDRHCRIEEYKLAGTPDELHFTQASVYTYLIRRGYGLEAQSRIVNRANQDFPVSYREEEIESVIRTAREILSRPFSPPPTYNCPSRWRRLQNRTAHDLKDITLAWNIGAVGAAKLRRMDMNTLEDLVRKGPSTLPGMKGMGTKKISRILNSAKAQLTRRPIRVAPFRLSGDPPEIEMYLDLEGSGELFQDDPAWNCIYLIGVIPRRKDGEEEYLSFLARRPLDERAILVAFLDFLRQREGRYRLYHWDHYEKTQLRKASQRHGLQAEWEALILPNLEDLCRAAQAAYVLPTPGFSIKVVAPYFGFQWRQAAWEVDAMRSAMIWFKQAAQGGNARDLDKVLRYNEDDCRAMIAVKDGLEKLTGRLRPESGGNFNGSS